MAERIALLKPGIHILYMSGYTAMTEKLDPEEESVADWMSDTPDTFGPDVEVHEAAAWLLEMGYRHMPVMADGELLGIVSIRDILWAIISAEE